MTSHAMLRMQSIIFLLAMILWVERSEAALWVSVDPNAVATRSDGMRAIVMWPEATAELDIELRILADCTGDGSPDDRDEACQGRGRAVLRAWRGRLKGGRYDERLSLAGLPEGAKLWLRATVRDPAAESPERPRGEPLLGQDDAMFFIARDRCTVWRTVLDLFGRGGCRVGVLDAMEDLLGASPERPDVVLEARRLAPSAAGTPRVVPESRGATGVAWDGNDVLVTLGRGPRTVAGLYRVREGAARALLWAAEPGVTPMAPYALGEGRVLLALEADEIGNTGIVSWLGTVTSGKMGPRVGLRRSVHQILAVQGERVLLLSRWQGRPMIVMVELNTGAETRLGKDGVLLDALMRSPVSGVTVWADLDRANVTGWDLWLLESGGQTARPLLQRPQHDLMPSWRGDGKEIVYLGQVEDPKPPQAGKRSPHLQTRQ